MQYSDNTEPVNGVARIARIDDDSFAAIGIGSYRIWVSDDSGLTWSRTQDDIGSWGGDWDIQFPRRRWDTPSDRLGIILKSTDGGHSWTQISHGAADRFEDIVMKPSGTGIAVGELGTIVRTTDFGRHWIAMQVVDESGIYNRMNAVEAVDEDSWITVGEFGVVFRSDDDGATWQLIARQQVDDIFDISFLDGNEGWSFGYRSTPYGFISHTTDGGQTWTFLQEDEVIPFAPTVGQVMPSGRGWGLYPQTIQAITDDSFDQTLTYRNLPSGDSWQSMEYATDNVGWYGGFFGGLLRTDNGGYIFESQTLPGFVWQNGDRLLDLRVLSDQEAYASTFRSGANFRGTVYKTTNGGTQWTALSAIFDLSNQGAGALNQIDVLPSGEIWVTAGSAGFIWSSGIPELASEIASDSFNVLRGFFVSGTLADTFDSDDSYLKFKPGITLNNSEPPVWLEFEGTLPSDAPTSLSVTLEAQANTLGLTQTIDMFNWNSGQYESVDSRAATFNTDSVATVNLTASISDYVQSGTGTVKTRMGWRATGPVLLYPWTVSIDQVIWSVQ